MQSDYTKCQTRGNGEKVNDSFAKAKQNERLGAVKQKQDRKKNGYKTIFFNKIQILFGMGLKP